MTRFGIIDEDHQGTKPLKKKIPQDEVLSPSLSTIKTTPVKKFTSSPFHVSPKLHSTLNHQKQQQQIQPKLSSSVFRTDPSPTKHRVRVDTSSPSKETWDSVVKKVYELDLKLKSILFSKEEKPTSSDLFPSSSNNSATINHEQQSLEKQTKSIESYMDLLKKKNKDMKNQVSKCIQDVKKRNEALAEEEKLKKKQREEDQRKLQLEQEQVEEQAKQQEERNKKEAEKQKQKQKEESELKKKKEADEKKSAIINSSTSAGQLVGTSTDTGKGYDPDYASSKGWEDYNKYISKVKLVKENFKQVAAQQPQIMNQFFMMKMKITQRVGQLTNYIEKVKEIAVALSEVFNEGQAISQLMYESLMNFAAKAIVKQAEKEVAVKRDMSFPLAVVCVLLYGKHEFFLDILLGRFMKKCLYVAGIYIKKIPGQSDDEYKKVVGYKKNDDGFETEIQYGERMCGIMALYAAILQTKIGKNSYQMDHAWTWFARILNLKPRKITPLLLHTFLEIAGHEFLNTYQAQARKLLQFLIHTYYPLIPEKAIAAKTRLQLMLEETFLRNGTIPPYEGHALHP